MVHNHILTLSFQNEKERILYQGESNYNATITDELIIKENAIIIHFNRSRKFDVESMLFTQNSIIRFELQRALCVYIAAVGSIPRILSLTLQTKNNTFSIEHESFTKQWENFKLDHTLPIEALAHIFQNKGKKAYIALSYFIEAQLIHESTERFRMAWSGVNALINILVAEKEAQQENKKIKALSYYMKQSCQTMKNACETVDTLPEPFWKQLQWYQFYHGKSAKTANAFLSNTLCHGQYTDSLLIEKIGKYCVTFVKDEKEKERFKKRLQVVKQKTTLAPKDRVNFLTCEYCYMVRNRSFHAVQAYPVFCITKETGVNVTHMLSDVLISLCKDLMIDFAR